ncbi:MAG TPA: hypothetical protein VFO40_01685 [Chthoniobacterales bacterium]|nr:hypothetical protein [Chthoniobacterales bacterium]
MRSVRAVCGKAFDRRESKDRRGNSYLRLGALLLSFLLFALPVSAQWTPLDPIVRVTKEADGVRALFKSGAALRLQVCSPSIVHVMYSPTANFPKPFNDVVRKTSWSATPFLETTDKQAVTLSGSFGKIAIESETGAVVFSTSAGQQLFRDAKRIMIPETVNGEKTFRGETWLKCTALTRLSTV